MDVFQQRKYKNHFTDVIRMYRQRIPYIIEDWIGINMNYFTSKNVPNNLITIEERKWIKDNDVDAIKKHIFTNIEAIDDPIDIYSKHSYMHDAVMMNREEVFHFLMVQGANLDMRDQNGYTPLLKAAALGRIKIAKALIEEGGVDPR